MPDIQPYIIGIGGFISTITILLANRGIFDNVLNKKEKENKTWKFNKADIAYLSAYKIFRVLQKSQMLTLEKHYNTSLKNNNASVFYYALKIKYWVVSKELKKFISELEVDKEYTKDELISKVLSFITLLINEIEKKWIEAGIPELARSKFNRWHAPHVEMFIDGVEGGMEDGENALDAMKEFMSCFKFIMLSTNQDTKKVFSNITAHYNGDLSPILTTEVTKNILNYLLYDLNN